MPEFATEGEPSQVQSCQAPPTVATPYPSGYDACMEVPRGAFVLTREARPQHQGLQLIYWAWSDAGPLRLCFTRRSAGFYIPATAEQPQLPTRQPTSLKTLTGEPVDELRFNDWTRLRAEADRLQRLGVPTYEADVKPVDRLLMEHRITGGCIVRGPAQPQRGHIAYTNPRLHPHTLTPTLRVASFDVESVGTDGPLLSVAIVIGEQEWALVHGSGPELPGVTYYESEATTLRSFLARIAELDPDVLIGWNVVAFDLTYLEQRCKRHGIPFRLGRAQEIARVFQPSRRGAPTMAQVPGRVVLDGIATLRAATWSFERWSLDHVAHQLLGRGKTLDPQQIEDRVGAILRLYHEDMPRFVQYNLQDCRLVRDIFERTHILDFAIERQQLTGVTMDRRAGAVAAFDHLYLPRLHRRGRVAPTTGTAPSSATASPGGYVMTARPGLFRNVLLLDFKSLYPSIIRTFLVDPLGMALADEESDPLAGFDGARFHRTEHILPALIDRLWTARDQAKRRQDAAAQRAIKILMNSFYGVLGTPACRFFDPRLASSITRRGHEVLHMARAHIEQQNLAVLYGDTDSLFVHVGEGPDQATCLARGQALATDLNTYLAAHLRDTLNLVSHLELELECCFSHLLLPTIRGGEQGSKKRYAGLAAGELIIKGLEAVRTDWTPLARNFQRELLRRVFQGEPYGTYIREITDQLFAGHLDAQLIYRKRLGQSPQAYRRQVPPHVAAARKLGGEVRVVEYVMTTRGPEPIQRQGAPPDYDHYLHKQLAPAAQTILPLLGDDFVTLSARQLSLF